MTSKRITLKRLASAALILGINTQAHAGTLTYETQICPVGGEEFEVVSTFSCSSTGMKTMSFQTVTSCEFVEHLPQCPSNKLPLYKEFDEQQIQELTNFIKTDEYTRAAKHSRYYLAYQLEKNIVPSEDISVMQILLAGYWYDTKQALNDADYRQAFLSEYEGEFTNIDENSTPYLRAIGAYYAMLHGDQNLAQTELAKARTAAGKEPEQLLSVYMDRIEACIANPKMATCEPDSPIINQ